MEGRAMAQGDGLPPLHRAGDRAPGVAAATCRLLVGDRTLHRAGDRAPGVAAC